MNYSNISTTMRRLPMIVPLMVLITGNIISDIVLTEFTYPFWFWFCFVVTSVTAILLRGVARIAAALAALFLLPFVVRSLLYSEPLPTDKALFMRIEVEEPPVIRGGTLRAKVRIFDCSDTQRAYKHIRHRAVMRTDTLCRLSCGDRITCTGYLHGMPDNGYGNLMRRRGCGYSLTLDSSDIVHITGGRTTLHAAAESILSRLPLSPDAAATTAAMSTGSRSRLSAELTQAYINSGTSHILAVSGMHVGIVFLLVNTLLRWMALLRHGRIIKNIAVTVIIWLYALVCGLTPSVQRAAVMFTILQTAGSLSREINMTNIIAGTAFIIIATDPDAMFDTGFLLSFAAVAGIISAVGLAAPHLPKERNSMVTRDIIILLITGIAAFAATMPLISHIFGRVAVAGVVLSPLIILCAAIIVIVSVLWIIFPISWFAPLFAALLERVASFQNEIVGAAATWRWSYIDFRLSYASVVVIYAAATILIITAGMRRSLRR